MRSRHPHPWERGGTYVTCQERREMVGSKCKLGSKLRMKGSFTGLGSDNELQECGQEAAVQASH